MTHERPAAAPGTPRIVSLLPAATEVIARLDALDLLVGVSQFCDHPPDVRGLPRVTSNGLEVDVPLLRELKPTVIITQSLCDVCAPTQSGVQRVIEQLDPRPRVVTMSGSTMDGVWTDFRRIGAAIGREHDALELIESIAHRYRAVHDTLKAAKAPRPRVAVIEWLDPLFSAGHWTPELVRRAGGVDVVAEAGAHSVRMSVQRVRDANPELLLFAPCGHDVHRAERESRELLARDEWSWARELPAWALDGNALTSRPGPRLADAVEVMASIFAPSLFAPPSGEYARLIRDRED